LSENSTELSGDLLRGTVVVVQQATHALVSANRSVDRRSCPSPKPLRRRYRKIRFTGSYNAGDETRFIANPYLGSNGQFAATVTFRPASRLQSVLKISTSKLVDPLLNTPALNVKIVRSQTTYQFTPRLLVRNITELNTGLLSNHTLFENILVTYRVNSGTVFYVGYDDRYKAGDAINATIFQDSTYQRTNRAIFTKIQYLFRHSSS
jgi:hypothetical protein